MSGADRVRLREPFTQAAEPYDHVRPATPARGWAGSALSTNGPNLAALERSPAPDYRMRCARCVRDFTSSLRNAFRR
jgi:hypothetical protein